MIPRPGLASAGASGHHSRMTVFARRLQAAVALALDANPKLSQNGLAEEIGISPGELSRLLSGVRESPTMETREIVARGLGVRFAWLNGLDDGPMRDSDAGKSSVRGH